ncbi:hypothetical protein A2U01_0114599, partial [Trifolium medium]|nr:hypothetical protein [Trifolium medium]
MLSREMTVELMEKLKAPVEAPVRDQG